MNASDELPPLKARSITLAVEAVASAYVSANLKVELPLGSAV